MKLVLDTAALWHTPLLHALSDACQLGMMEHGDVEAILPAVAYAERLRQLAERGQDLRIWRARLEMMGIRVEPFSESQAEALAHTTVDVTMWKRHARDFLVAAHAAEDRIAVTPDEGPAWEGRRRLTPDAATAELRRMLGAHH